MICAALLTSSFQTHSVPFHVYSALTPVLLWRAGRTTKTRQMATADMWERKDAPPGRLRLFVDFMLCREGWEGGGFWEGQ